MATLHIYFDDLSRFEVTPPKQNTAMLGAEVCATQLSDDSACAIRNVSRRVLGMCVTEVLCVVCCVVLCGVCRCACAVLVCLLLCCL